MATESQREVYRALNESQNKYTYFLLAAAGAGIALAVRQTHGSGFEFAQIPLALGGVVWGVSFYFGCRRSALVSSALYANLDLLRVQSGLHPEVGSNPERMHAASEGIREALELKSGSANRLGRWQFQLLVLGALLYLVWHLVEMSLETM
ncbi:MAG: hypothetical protein JXA57_06850 [Armatimonadetes bacterium]|nr:hypothetical protein [Armatimonadota bacterium]